MTPIWYVASPYTTTSDKLRELRAQLAMHFAARLRAQLHGAGKHVFVFSPIAHSHEMAEYMEAHGCPVHDDEFWRVENEAVLERSETLIVLCLDGWEQSKGVTREIEFAEKRGMRVLFLGYSAQIPEAA